MNSFYLHFSNCLSLSLYKWVGSSLLLYTKKLSLGRNEVWLVISPVFVALLVFYLLREPLSLFVSLFTKIPAGEPNMGHQALFTSIVGKLMETVLQCRWISECIMIVFHHYMTLFELVRCKRGLQGFDFPLCERQERPPEKLEISITLRKMGNHPKHNTTAQCSAHLVGPP